jgi:hypothetical protein
LKRIIKSHYAELSPLAQQAVEKIKSVALLQVLVDDVIDAQNLAEARAALEKACANVDSAKAVSEL